MYSRTLATLNINAISSRIKINLLKDFVWNYDIDFVFLQEVSFEDFSFIPSHLALVNISEDRKGTAILIRKNIQFSSVLMNPNGRITSVCIGGINFINVYAHSGSKFRKERNELFSQEIIPHLSTDAPNVILGDFNCILLKRDSNGAVKNLCPGLSQLVSSLDLLDVGKIKDKQTVYTFFRGESMSRLDRIYAPKNFLERVLKFETIPTCFSDHYSLHMKFEVESNEDVILHGRGFWKINPSLLKDEDICNEFKKEIIATRRRVAYREDFCRWWNEHFKCKARSFFKTKSFEINKRIAESKSFLYGCLREISQKQNAGIDVTNELCFVKTKMMDIEQQRLNNFKLKIQTDNIVEDEKLSLFHFSKHINEKRTVMQLKINDQLTSKKNDLQPYLENHFRKLFENDNTFVPGADNILNYIRKSVSFDEKAALVKPIEDFELEIALKQVSKKKSPGPDGLTYEFYTTFIDYLKSDLLKLFNAYLSGSTISPDFVEGVITLIPKKEHSHDISDKRPISMLNCDYKLFTKILMNRLQPIIDSLVGPGQSACISEKSCISNLKLLRNITIKSNISKRFKGLIVSLDLEKAFDRVNHSFLWLILEKFGFPQQFISCIRNLYSKASSRVLFNGFLTNKIAVRSSVRQGCPLSMALFILYIEPLIRMLYDNVMGCYIDGEFIKVLAYADDITIFIRNNHEFDKMLELINYFSIYAKIKLNIQKSLFMRLNNCPSGPHLLKEVDSVKILGVELFPSFQDTVMQNYTKIIKNIKYLVSIHLKRRLNIFQKVWVLNYLILSKLWYLSQIFPPNNVHVAELKTISRNFIFKGIGLFKVSLAQLYLDVDKGGIFLIDVESKTKSLFIKNILFGCQNSGKDNFMISQKNNPCLTRNAREWLTCAITDKNFTDMGTSYKIYNYLLSIQNIKPKIVEKYPTLDWESRWNNLNKKFISSEEKHSLYLIFNDIVPTKVKLLSCKVKGVDNNVCTLCGKEDTLEHRIKKCQKNEEIWNWIQEVIISKLKISIRDPEEILNRSIESNQYQSKTALWLVAQGISYNLYKNGKQSLPDFTKMLREKRWNNVALFRKEFKHWINLL